MKKNYLNAVLCKECGGKCCKHMPGIAYPEDFKKPLEESLVKAFESGNWAIDWYEGDPTGAGEIDQAFYLRPMIKGVTTLFDPSWGGECVFLTPKGCTLKPDERPKTCRMLEPISLSECVFHAAKTKKEGATMWLPFTKVILDAAKKVGEYVGDAPEPEHLGFLEALLKT